MKELSKRLKDFCKYKAQGYSNEESAIKAGYSKTTANKKSHLWMDDSRIIELIEKLKAKVQKVAEEKFNYTIEEHFKNLMMIRDKGLEKTPKGYYQGLQSATKAEELMGRLYGCYEVDNKQKTLIVPIIKDDI